MEQQLYKVKQIYMRRRLPFQILKKSIKETENALSILLGKGPGTIDRTAQMSNSHIMLWRQVYLHSYYKIDQMSTGG